MRLSIKSIPKPYFYLGAVLILALLVFVLERPTEPKPGDRFEQLYFENLDAAAVTRIEIEHLLSGVQLEKKEGKWQVAALQSKLKKDLQAQENQVPSTKYQVPEWFPADSERVDLSLTTLTDLMITALAGKNPKRHGYFEVNLTGMQIRLFDAAGKKLVHLYIGKTGPAFTESYVRKEGEDNVYISNRYLRSSFPPEVNDWRQKSEKDSPK